ncbi:MAG: DoxX family protein [Ferruginibacter sp.]
MNKISLYIDKGTGYAILFLRIIIGWRLIAGAWPFVMQTKPIEEIKEFFILVHIPFPLLSAYLSVYAQFICGILFITGLWLRPASFVMILNFVVAILAVHLYDGIEKSFAAWVLLAVSFFFLFNGAGKISLKVMKGKRK